MYFRFCNKRPHIEIQLSVSIFRPTYLLLSACHSASAYQTSFELNHPTPVVVMTSYQFFKMANWIMVNHPRCVVVGLSYIIDSRLDPICNFWDIAIVKCRRFSLKLPIRAHFRGSLVIFPRTTSHITYQAWYTEVFSQPSCCSALKQSATKSYRCYFSHIVQETSRQLYKIWALNALPIQLIDVKLKLKLN